MLVPEPASSTDTLSFGTVRWRACGWRPVAIRNPGDATVTVTCDRGRRRLIWSTPRDTCVRKSGCRTARDVSDTPWPETTFIPVGRVTLSWVNAGEPRPAVRVKPDAAVRPGQP